MFQSVINQPGLLSAGRFGAGMWVSLLVHAGVLTGVVGLSGKAVEQLQKEPELIFNVPQPPRGNPNPPKVVTTPTQPKPKPKKTELVQPKKIAPLPPEPEQKVVEADPTPPDTTPDEDLPYIPGSDPNGVDKGGTPFAKLVPGLDGLTQGLGGTGEDVLPFGAGMTLPELRSGATLQYTREALEARVSGTVIARCTITREGSVENCKIIKGLPYMDAAVIDALTTRQYRPVHFQGRPVSVSYTFNVTLRLP